MTSKRKKTEDDYREIARLDWEVALYFDPGIGPCLPAANVAASVRDGGKRSRSGSDIERALLVDPISFPILYDGPRDLEGLWSDERFRFEKPVVVERKKTMRTRPIFRSWALEAEALLLNDVLDLDVVRRAANDAGMLVGIGDYRRGGYGRYEVVVEELG